MKKIVFFIAVVLLSFTINSQEITGQWNGTLKVPGGELRIVFNINNSEKGLSATMDSPDQGAKGIPVTTTTFDNSILKLEIPAAAIVYQGTLSREGIIHGNFIQAGNSIALNMSRTVPSKPEIKRPQEPKTPYSYYTEEVQFTNKIDKNTLAGTLSLPQKNGIFPAVILITGSGPQNRDEEIVGHKPFLVIADYLTKKGIAVLRFDDRGIGKSTGEFKTATTTDFVKDVQSAVDYLRSRQEIDNTKIGLIGHSEGGVIAPMVAGNSPEIDFIVLMAGTGLRGDQLMLLQKEKIERQMGVPEAGIQQGQEIFATAYQKILAAAENDNALKSDLNSYFKSQFGSGISEDQITGITTQITSPWMFDFLKLDPSIALAKVKCPVLILNGALDLQVPATENVESITKALTKGGNRKVTTKIFPQLNHLFQECKTGSPDEYSTIEQTIAPIALEEISKWILTQVK